jgi:Tol biopolymer transport system component
MTVVLRRKNSLILLVAIAALGALSVVLGNEREAARAAFPGANGKIVFSSAVEANMEIYVMNADGSQQQRLTNAVGFDSYPAWSPDGEKIAFMSERDGNYEIYVMDADGSNQTNLTNNLALDVGPVWSPDGTQIAFSSNRDGDADIYTLRIEGSEGPTNLTNATGNDTQPAWSPDGLSIAFSSDSLGGLAVMNADGSNPVAITTEFDGTPDWSPDGTRIVVQRWDGTFVFDVFSMNANGTGVTQLTAGVLPDQSPAWRPDGLQIVYSSAASDYEDIWVMDPDGTNATNLTNSTTADREPDWQSIPVDSDQDSCTDGAEFIRIPESQVFGGHRDKSNFWDFFDTPDASNVRDRNVSGLDFFRVLQRVGATGDPQTDPLSVPSPAPTYHTAFDRGPSSGPNPWNLTAADGAITGQDFFAVLAQFGHSCA